MGQAKLRGSFEQRKAQSIESRKEQERLDKWLEDRQKNPYDMRARKAALALIVAAALSPDFSKLNK